MKQLLLTLSFTLGLANPIFALEAREFHAHSCKVITKVKVAGQEINNTGDGNMYSWLIIEYRVSCKVVVFGGMVNTIAVVF